MMWKAVVPLKLGPQRKSRLAPRLSPSERADLGDRMAAHVVACLRKIDNISRLCVLAPRPVPGLEAAWVRDGGAGLNAELAAFRLTLDGSPLLVIHADLPLLEVQDITAFLAEAERAGAAIAPDRHGTGTNALALAGFPGLPFAFGEESFRKHLHATGNVAAVVRREGLAVDVDTSEDLDAAIAAGFRP